MELGGNGCNCGGWLQGGERSEGAGSQGVNRDFFSPCRSGSEIWHSFAGVFVLPLWHGSAVFQFSPFWHGSAVPSCVRSDAWIIIFVYCFDPAQLRQCFRAHLSRETS